MAENGEGNSFPVWRASIHFYGGKVREQFLKRSHLGALAKVGKFNSWKKDLGRDVACACMGKSENKLKSEIVEASELHGPEIAESHLAF